MNCAPEDDIVWNMQVRIKYNKGYFNNTFYWIIFDSFRMILIGLGSLI
jgi:hypothetical protein